MRELFAALGLCVYVTCNVMLVTPYEPTSARLETVRIVYACPQGYVCFPAVKDQAQVARTKFAADFNPVPQRKVRISSIVPADYPPYVQAAETRKKRVARR